MKFKRTIRRSFPSAKVKSIQIHPSRPVAVVALFTGHVQIWDIERMAVLTSIHVSNEPIRSCAILERMDWVLVGSDDGNINIYELARYRKVKTLDAHGDFIRKIEGHPQAPMFITASDDTTLKLWSYEGDVSQSMVYSGHGHFVMDVCFYPNDSSKFVSCSLDMTIKVWSTKQPSCIKTFKGHTSGINSICFLRDSQYMVSGADDLTLRVWDFQTTQCIATLNGHTNNINKVYQLMSFSMFASCSEDGTLRLWNNKTFKQEDFIAMQGRVWDVKDKNNKILVGCDEELVFMDSQQASSLVDMSRNKIFYSVSDSIFVVKTDGSPKELSSLGFHPTELHVSPSGKMVAVCNENEFKIFSSLGFRNKVSGEGRDLSFISEDEFLVRCHDGINFYKKADMVRNIGLKADRLFYLGSGMMGCNVYGYTRIYTLDGSFVLQMDHPSEHLKAVGGFLVACGSVIRIYRIHRDVIDAFIEQEIEVPECGISDGFELLGVEHYAVSSCIVHDGVFYFVANSKAYYIILCDTPYVHQFSTINGVLAGISEALVFYLSDKDVESKRIDVEFLRFQRSVLLGESRDVPDGIRAKAIVFFESLGMHDEALELCIDDNQKFEILLKLGRYDEAFERANSMIKYDKLGKHFLSSNQLDKASECFLRSRNWTSLLLTDTLSGKKHLATVGAECKKEGRMNCAFFAYLKCDEYRECAKLLEGTPFHSLFVRTHLGQ